MRIKGSFLQSKVARRVFALFVLTALIPVAFLSLFSHYQVTRLLIEQTHRELTVYASSYGTTAYERLLLAERTLGNVTAGLSRELPADQLQRLSMPVIRSLLHLSVAGERKVVFGSDFEFGKLGPAEYEFMRSGETLLQGHSVGKDSRGLVLLRLIDAAQADKGWIAVEVNPAYLWTSKEEMPYMTDVCVLDARWEPLHCSNPDVQSGMMKAAELGCRYKRRARRANDAGGGQCDLSGGDTRGVCCVQVWQAVLDGGCNPSRISGAGTSVGL